MNKKTLGYIISSARKKKKLNQKQLAEKIIHEDGDPISLQYLSDIEHDRRNPSSDHIIKQFSKVLRIKADDLHNLNKMFPDTERKKKLTFQSFEKTCIFNQQNIQIYNDDILKVTIPKSSIDLIITSPPYNVDIHYNSHKDTLSYKKYLEFTSNWISKCYELSKEDGRFCLNIPLDKNKGGQQSVCADITTIAKQIGWNYHSTIIWNEGNISRRTAWGSWMSASAPYVIAPVEVILILYKKEWKKTHAKKNDIKRKEFMEWTNGVWTFPGQSKKGALGHPAAFPVELPRRCIKLFSFVGDTVLDPFLGSGSTLIAVYLQNRKGIGVEIDRTYCNSAIQRLEQEAQINQHKLL